MKRSILPLLILSFSLTSGIVYSQVGIGTTTPDPSSILEVSSSSQGILVPRMTTAQRGLIASPAMGLMVFDSTEKTMWYNIGTGAGWREFQHQKIWHRLFTAGKSYLYYQNDSVGIGTSNPVYRIHLRDSNTTTIRPAMTIEQVGTNDASLLFRLNNAPMNKAFTIGMDRTDSTFKISDSLALTGNAHTQFSISTAHPGITHLNHQSRSRAHLLGIMFAPGIFGQPIPAGVWYQISFDMTNWDEQAEFTPGAIVPPPPFPVNPTPAFFTIKEKGYYQINARTEFMSWEYQQITVPSYVSIAVFVNNNVASYGNKLCIFSVGGDRNADNDAPVVNDILYLNAGDVVDIRVFQNYSIPFTWIKGGLMPQGGSATTYVSIHKIS